MGVAGWNWVEVGERFSITHIKDRVHTSNMLYALSDMLL